MKVIYVSGYWSPNIGNAFINLGAAYALKKVYGQENVSPIFDQHIYNNLSHTKKYIPIEALRFIDYVNADCVVLMGPIITPYFLTIWKDTIVKLREKKKQYVIIGAGLMNISEKDLSTVRDFLVQYPPTYVTTRDNETYNVLKGAVKNIANGIDMSFFLPDAYTPLKSSMGKNIVINFDKIIEPKISLQRYAPDDIQIQLDDLSFFININGIISRIGLKTDRLTDMIVYLLSLLPKGSRMDLIGGYTIIRTDHRFAPMFVPKVYRYANSFCADIPETYIDIYANTDLTVSDRVHACAVTLAYGNSAMIFAQTKRSGLLNRVNVTDIYSKPCRLNMDYIEQEKNKILQFMADKL